MTSLSHRGRRPWALYAYAGLFVVFLYAPVVLLPIFSLNDSTIIAFPFRGVTLRWYQMLVADAELVRAFRNSVLVGLCVAPVATLLGTLGAWGVVRYRPLGYRPVVGFLMLPLVVPGLVLGTSLLLLISDLKIGLSLVTIAVGHLILCIPFSLAVMISRFEGFDRSLEEASRDLGESPVSTFFKIVLPTALPGLLSSLLMTFTISFDEFILSFFLAGPDATLPIYMWSQLRFPAKLPAVLALASLIFLCSFALVTLSERLRRMGQSEKEVL